MASQPGDGPAATLLGVFARYWQPGQVKTRLARWVGDESAARLHRQFVETTLARLSDLAESQWLAFTPAESLSLVQNECRAASNWQITAQTDGDLGSRMSNFFRQALQQADRVVLVGSDSPDLPPELVAHAFAELERDAVVLGPAADGGYYLIGMRNSANDLLVAAELFEDIPWSTPDVFSLTLDRLSARGIDCHVLPTWRDVDEWDDLLALDQRLSQRSAEFPEPLRAMVAAVITEFARCQESGKH